MDKIQDQVDKLEIKLETHMTEYQERQLRQDIAHAQNMEAIKNLTEATQGVVDAWKAANSFQRFIKWLSTFGLLAVAISWLYDLPILKLLLQG